MIPAINPFERARSFLSSPEANNRNIEDKVDLMRQYVEEMDPSNPNSATLSSQRKKSLMERVVDLYTTVLIELHPVAPVVLGPDQIYQQHVGALKNLMGMLELSPLDFHKKGLKKLPPELRERIYKIVWIASGCPDKALFSECLLKGDTSIFKVEFPSITGNGAGNLLQQTLEGLTYDYHLAQGHPNSANLIQQKVDFFKGRFSDSKLNNAYLKAVFKDLHPQVQNALRAQQISPPFYGRGIDFGAYHKFGAHFNGYTNETRFQVYAPNARKVVLNLTAYGSTQHAIEMKKENDGTWSAKTYDARPGRTYHYMITGKDGGDPFKKVDPFAFQNLIHDPHGKRENHESVVVDIDKQYSWTDGAWMAKRAHQDFSKQPLNIYEVHSPSWQVGEGGRTLNWRELAPRLCEYCKNNYYNAVELMALFSHPQPISMGYQITNFFAPHPEMGSWEDFQYFVDYMHNNNISVFADWVPAHFALDEFALCDFDGGRIFEDDDLEVAYHPEWGTRIFDFKKQFTRDFLGSNADFLLRDCHVDGLRVDAVSSMLYLNYSRGKQKGWKNRYNKRGTEVNLEAQHFTRHLNAHIHKQFPGAITMAEESSGFPNVVRSVHEKGDRVKKRGLGFDFTWQMGFMNDTLKYWQADAAQRKDLFNLFTSTVQIVDGDSDIRPRGKQIIPYSHDENANAKGTILTKMSGMNMPEKFANGRLALAYQLLRGGGIVLDFMGNETLQKREWHWIVDINTKRPLGEERTASFEWEELKPSADDHRYHTGAQACRRDLNKLFQESPGLWDQTDSGFGWIEATDKENCVLSFHRRGSGQQFACVFNTSDKDIPNYKINLPDGAYAPELAKLSGIREVYNTDALQYGGQGRTNASVNIIRNSSGHPIQLELRLPPYTAIVLEEAFS